MKGDLEEKDPEEKTEKGGEDQRSDDIEEASPYNLIRPISNPYGADHPADQGMGRTGGNAEEPGDEVPGDGPNEDGNNQKNGQIDHLRVKSGDIDDIFADGLSHRRSKKKGTDEFADGRQCEGSPWRECPVVMMVATTLAASWNPFVKSKKEGQTHNEDGKEKYRRFDDPPSSTFIPI